MSSSSGLLLLAPLLLLLLVISSSVVASSDKCANVCTCKWKSGKETVECRQRGLASVPDGLEPMTQVLDVSDNDIAALPNRIFVKVRLTNLQRLYLRNCRISRIDAQAFDGLTNLVELDLSQNKLASVPTASFASTPFLRDLSLARNPLGKIPAHAFKDMPTLVKLDLSDAELSELAAKGFQGLKLLESLKLNHNRISTLHPGTFEPLEKLTSIALHENPWVCDCHLREMKSWLVKQNLPTLIAPICHRPEQLVNKSFDELSFDEFACRPVMLIVSRYAEATIGENASIVCTVTAIPPARIKWIWNGKLLSNHSAVNSYQKIIIYEEGSFRKRSTLVLTNAQETDSSSFFCVAENQAGSVEANFTLHVSLRTAGMSTLGSGQIAGISAALLVLILLILLTIMILFVRLRRMPQKDVKSPAPDGADSSQATPAAATDDELQRAGGQELVSGEPPSAAAAASKPQPQQLRDAAPAHQPHSGRHGQPPGLSHRSGLRGEQQLPRLGLQHLDHGSASSSSAASAATSRIDAGHALLLHLNPDLIRDTRRGSSSMCGNDAEQQQQQQQQGLPSLVYGATGEYSRVFDMDESQLLYTECLNWEASSTSLRPSLSINPYVGPIVGGGDVQQQLLGSQQQVGLPPPPPPPAPTQPSLPQQQPQQQPQSQQQQQQETFPPGAKQIRVWQKGVPVLPPVSALKRVLGSTRSSPDEGYQEGTGTDV
ncbi:unnamed protein product [Trichogramma brassicae]|uniref:Ig-like domain-containing protein n=1 Tax=Trichogramma brassicae TaxID=86971 RepID=A0A6H5J698_9HYME|nr:unnamed protein product [Trichogramma brassicae]